MAGEDKRYTDWLRKQPCARCETEFRIEVHHPLWGTTYSPELPRPPKAIEGARKGKGQKSHDHYGLPLCIKCHIPGIHRGGGSFEGMTPDEREAWEREQIPIYRNRYAMQSPEPFGALPARVGKAKRARIGEGWTVPLVLDLLQKEARHRPGEVAAALTGIVELIERDTL